MVDCCFLRLFSFPRFSFSPAVRVSFSPSLLLIFHHGRLACFSPSAFFPSSDGSPFSVMESFSRYWSYLDARRFGMMRIVGDQQSIYDRNFGKYCDTTVGARIKRWGDGGGRRASPSRCTHASMDSSFLQCYEEVDYKRWLSSFVAAHRTAEGD